MAANDWTERPAAAAELRGALRAVTGAAGALLRMHLLAGAVDLAAQLGLVRATLTTGELPIDATLNDVRPRFETEDVVRHLDRAGFLAFKRGDLQFHVTHLPAWRGRLAAPVLPRRKQLALRGTCRASALPSEVAS